MSKSGEASLLSALPSSKEGGKAGKQDAPPQPMRLAVRAMKQAIKDDDDDAFASAFEDALNIHSASREE